MYEYLIPFRVVKTDFKATTTSKDFSFICLTLVLLETDVAKRKSIIDI